MKAFLTLAALALLAACGADGAPVAPASQDATTPGLTVSGCASTGLVYGQPALSGRSRC